MIRRTYSPPFQAKAPRMGADDLGRAVKGLIETEVKRTSEVSFAVESFGCDGKPVLSRLRGLACETDGRLTVAGTKNGMPFRLGAELPRGLGSAIRGAGGRMARVEAGAAMRATETVLYDSVGNYWSLDQGTTPVYLGATPPLANGDGVTPATCVQDPVIRPYELRHEYISGGGGGEGGDYEAFYHWGGAGWIEDSIGGAVIAAPVAYPYVDPATYWRVEQYIPDETTGPTHAACWPTSNRIVEVEWYPANTDTPLDWATETDNSIDELMTQYGSSPPWRYFANRFTRPLIEHISIGGIVDEDAILICVEKNNIFPFGSRIALRERGTGTLLVSTTYTARSDARHMFTPDKTEGFLLQTGAITGGDTVQMRRYHTRSSPAAAFGSSLAYQGVYNVTLPLGAAVPWAAEPVWFRVGTVSRMFNTNPRLTPLLARW